MTIVARWYGDGLADATPIGTATAGTGDQPFNTVTSGAATVDASGPRPPRIRITQQASSPAQMIWTSATLGTLTGHAVRMYVELTAWPSAGTPLLQAYGAGNSALRWRLDVNVAGLLRLRNASDSVIATAATPLPTGQVHRIEVVVDGTSATVTAHTGDQEGAPLVSLAGTVGSGCDAVRVGTPNVAPTWPTLYVDDVAVADVAAPIGPRVRLLSGTWTVPVGWEAAQPRGIQELAGAWSVPVTWAGELAGPAAPLLLDGRWEILPVLTVDTGTPPVAVLQGGVWRPGALRQMVSGTWQ